MDNWEDIKYCVYQLEACPETRRLHFQGYVIWTKKKTLTYCKTQHATAHWEPRRGTHEQARDYCKKEDTRSTMCEAPVEFGTEPKPGQRNDILAVKAAIDVEGGIHYDKLWEEHFPAMVKFRQSFWHYWILKIPPRDFRTEVAVFFGPTGTGKTRHLLQNLPQDQVFFLNRARTAGDPWLDFYDPMKHNHVVLDDFYGWIKWDTLLRMCDHAPLLMETKGSKVQFRPKYIWITSNKHPNSWYKEYPPHRLFETLERRIDVIAEFQELDKEPIYHKQPPAE